jgi:hypothetical protein
LQLVDAVTLKPAPGQLCKAFAVTNEDEALGEVSVDLELAHETPDEAKAL